MKLVSAAKRSWETMSELEVSVSLTYNLRVHSGKEEKK